MKENQSLLEMLAQKFYVNISDLRLNHTLQYFSLLEILNTEKSKYKLSELNKTVSYLLSKNIDYSSISELKTFIKGKLNE